MKKHLKRGVCAAAVIVLVCGTAEAVIPVQDDASILEQVQQLIQEAKTYVLQQEANFTQQLQWAKQVQQALVQAEQYALETEQFLAFVHNPNLGAVMGLLNQAGLTSTFPVSPNSMMSLVGGFQGFSAGGIPNLGGINALLGNLSGLAYNANHVYTPTDNSWNSQQLIANANGIDATQGTALASYQQLQAHEQALQALRTQLNAAVDPKDVQDLQAEIALEQLWTGNQQASLSAVQITASTQDAERVQRDNESLDKGIDAWLTANGMQP